MTHTPGPWTITSWKHPDYDTPMNIKSGDKVVVGFHGDDKPTMQANARLIAAAPDLLEACKRLVKEGKDWESANNDFARAAIAKAEGSDNEKIHINRNLRRLESDE